MQQLALHAPLNIGLVVLVVDYYYYIDTTTVSASMATGAAATTDRNKNTERERKAIKENSQVAQPLDPRRNPETPRWVLGCCVVSKKTNQTHLGIGSLYNGFVARYKKQGIGWKSSLMLKWTTSTLIESNRFIGLRRRRGRQQQGSGPAAAAAARAIIDSDLEKITNGAGP